MPSEGDDFTAVLGMCKLFPQNREDSWEWDLRGDGQGPTQSTAFTRFTYAKA